jgi:thiol-disulfide isomerase/thioredoxin
MFFCLGFLEAQTTLKSKEIININEFVNELNINPKLDVYSLNSENFLELITSSTKEYHLFYSFATWCGPCREYLPMLLDLVEKNSDNLELYVLIIEKDDSKELLHSKAFFSKIENFDRPLYCLTTGKSKKPVKRYLNFVESILPNHIEYGLSLNIMYNNMANVLYASNYNETKEDILTNLNQLLIK